MLQIATSSIPCILSQMGTLRLLSIEFLSKFTTPSPIKSSLDFEGSESNLTFMSSLSLPLSLMPTGNVCGPRLLIFRTTESVQSPVCWLINRSLKFCISQEVLRSFASKRNGLKILIIRMHRSSPINIIIYSHLIVHPMANYMNIVVHKCMNNMENKNSKVL